MAQLAHVHCERDNAMCSVTAELLLHSTVLYCTCCTMARVLGKALVVLVVDGPKLGMRVFCATTLHGEMAFSTSGLVLAAPWSSTH